MKGLTFVKKNDIDQSENYLGFNTIKILDKYIEKTQETKPLTEKITNYIYCLEAICDGQIFRIDYNEFLRSMEFYSVFE